MGQVKLVYKFKLRLRAERACLSDSVAGTCCADTHLSKASWPSLPPSTQETAAEMSTLVGPWVCLLLTSGVSQNIHQAQLLRRTRPTLPTRTGFPAVCTPSLPTRSCLVRNFTSHLGPHGAEPRRVLPLHGAQECGASLVVEGDDDTGGWQIRGVGQRWATGKRAGSQRQAGARGTLRQLRAFLYPLDCALGQLYKVEKETACLPRHDAPSHVDPAPTRYLVWGSRKEAAD